MTLKEQILRYLAEKPATANELAKALGYDKSFVRKILAVLLRRGLVHVRIEQKGRVTYKLYELCKEHGA